MIKYVTFENDKILPDEETVLLEMGIKKKNNASPTIIRAIVNAVEEFFETSKPVGILSKISKQEFENVFHGEGKNDNESPVIDIFNHSTFLALYAVTLGPDIANRIDHLSGKNNYAGAYILNTVASQAADNASTRISKEVFPEGALAESDVILGYSPGYCGWDISGQKRLFEFIDPGRIGISLNESYLMSPIKSVTGVLIGGPADIHTFIPDFPFCRSCRTKSCTDRFREIRRLNRGSQS